MSLDANRLGDAMAAAMAATPPDPATVIGHGQPWTTAELNTYKAAVAQFIWRGVASALVTEITSHAVVTCAVAGTATSVVAGAATAPVSGSASGTVS